MLNLFQINIKMKKSTVLLFLLIPFISFSQKADYIVSSYLIEGPKAPNTHYIGEAWLNGVLQGDAELNFNITKATFRKNSTLDWHKHSTPQVLIVVDGEGYYQERGKDAIIIKKGECRKEISSTLQFPNSHILYHRIVVASFVGKGSKI
jgi:mannose-6-phosphate isomerase-like protein (cupin superfamily)